MYLQSFLGAQWIKDLALLVLWLWSLLWHGFDPWPGNLCMLPGARKTDKQTNKQNKKSTFFSCLFFLIYI